MTQNQKKWLLIAVALLLLAGLKFYLINWYLQQRAPRQPPQLLNCQPLQGCTLPAGGALRFLSPPQHGQPYVIQLQGVAGDLAPTVEFSMTDMDMGFNRYAFVRDGQAWRATVTLPVCASGSRNWLATLRLGTAAYSLPFVVQ